MARKLKPKLLVPVKMTVRIRRAILREITDPDAPEVVAQRLALAARLPGTVEPDLAARRTASGSRPDRRQRAILQIPLTIKPKEYCRRLDLTEVWPLNKWPRQPVVGFHGPHVSALIGKHGPHWRRLLRNERAFVWQKYGELWGTGAK